VSELEKGRKGRKKKEKEGIGEELRGSYTLNNLNSQKSLK